MQVEVQFTCRKEVRNCLTLLTSSVNCWAIAFLIKPITVDFSSPICRIDNEQYISKYCKVTKKNYVIERLKLCVEA